MSLVYPCVYHENGKCKRFSDDEEISFCVFGPCKYETPSNADRIRAMSDEEMADFLTEFSLEAFASGAIKFSNVIMDAHQRLEWLQQPAEEE